MIRRSSAILLAVLLAVAFSTMAFAQDSTKAAPMKEEPTKAAPMKEGKAEMMKSDKAMGPLYSATCAPECGFMVQSHDKKEISDILIKHAMKMHKKKVTEKEAMEMIKGGEAPPAKE
jgi:predicted small metal-binding protein